LSATIAEIGFSQNGGKLSGFVFGFFWPLRA
jgi:hypothetical protein